MEKWEKEEEDDDDEDEEEVEWKKKMFIICFLIILFYIGCLYARNERPLEINARQQDEKKRQQQYHIHIPNTMQSNKHQKYQTFF